jgi:two-component system, chemotaxis family, protein-glutamate methylesterase/glutaminase
VTTTDRRFGQRKIRVLVVDDSAVVRTGLAAILAAEPAFEVQTASDPVQAEARTRTFPPDVVILDLEMPRGGGIAFFRKQMQTRPVPVILCSALAGRSADEAVEALREGAVELMEKPRFGVRDFLEEGAARWCELVRGAAEIRVRARAQPVRAPSPLVALAPVRAPEAFSAIVGIGASTGGPEAIERILRALPADVPPVLVVQHMPEGFTAAFARRLDSVAGMSVKLAESGDRLEGGRVLVARGDHHLVLHRHRDRFLVELDHGPRVGYHRPSVDRLFESVAKVAGEMAIGVLLTGMGGDGARGLLELHRRGGHTIVQDEESSVVFGMPQAAIRLGAVDEVVPLDGVAERICAAVGERNGVRAEVSR